MKASMIIELAIVGSAAFFWAIAHLPALLFGEARTNPKHGKPSGPKAPDRKPPLSNTYLAEDHRGLFLQDTKTGVEKRL